MDNVFLQIGNFKIYWYSMTILIGILFTSYFTYKRLKELKLSEDQITNIMFYSIIFGIVGARLYYVLFNLDYYLVNPIDIIKVWEGGLAIHGGLIGGIAFLYFYTKKIKISIFDIIDTSALYILISQAIGRWGNFFNGEAHGVETTYEFLKSIYIPEFIIDGMRIDGVIYHPTFLYESIYNVIGFVVLLVVKKNTKPKKGRITGMYFIWYSFGRFFIESMRTDSLMLGNIRVAMLISVLLFIIGFYLVLRKEKANGK